MPHLGIVIGFSVPHLGIVIAVPDNIAPGLSCSGREELGCYSPEPLEAGGLPEITCSRGAEKGIKR